MIGAIMDRHPTPALVLTRTNGSSHIVLTKKFFLLARVSGTTGKSTGAAMGYAVSRHWSIWVTAFSICVSSHRIDYAGRRRSRIP